MTTSLPIVESLIYPSRRPAADGLLTPLAPGLLRLTGATTIDLRERRGLRRAILWFRRGARRVFYLAIVRQTGRLVIEVGGLERRKVRQAIQLCRDHFDAILGID
jgi:hypothetical protein